MIYINDQWFKPEDAKISVMDRGFLFGDGVYEVIPAFGRQPFRFEQHWQRLQQSLDAIQLSCPVSREQLLALLQQLIGYHPHFNQSLYLQITRGVASRRDHSIDPSLTPTLVLFSSPLPDSGYKPQAIGVKAITRPDIRWLRCDIKAITLLANVLLKQQAQAAGAYDSILIRDGQALEGTASNLFILRQGCLITPQLSQFILGGITRDLVLELAQSQGWPLEQRPIRLTELQAADEIWLTSSTRELLPVIELDGKPVGQGQIGPGWQQMAELYFQFKQQWQPQSSQE